jgi:integrase
VNNALGVLRHIYRRAVDWKQLGSNPIGDLKLLKESRSRVRFLSTEEIEKLFAAFPSKLDKSALAKVYLKPLILVAINSGLRLSEILGLERRDIDWERGIATVLVKGGEKRQVHLNEGAMEALRSLPPRLDTPRLFPFTRHQASMTFSRMVERAGISDFRFHDLRHSFASYQAMSGVSPRGLQALLGHKDQRMTMRYSHLSDGFLREAVERVVIRAPEPASVG